MMGNNLPVQVPGDLLSLGIISSYVFFILFLNNQETLVTINSFLNTKTTEAWSTIHRIYSQTKLPPARILPRIAVYLLFTSLSPLIISLYELCSFDRVLAVQFNLPSTKQSLLFLLSTDYMRNNSRTKDVVVNELLCPHHKWPTKIHGANPTQPLFIL